MSDQQISKNQERAQKIKRRVSSISNSMWKIIDASEKKFQLIDQEFKGAGIRESCLKQLVNIDDKAPWLGPSETRRLFLDFAAKRYKNLVIFALLSFII